MKIAKLTRDQMKFVLFGLDRAIENWEDYSVAYDATDGSIKVKIGDAPWGPPIRTEEI